MVPYLENKNKQLLCGILVGKQKQTAAQLYLSWKAAVCYSFSMEASDRQKYNVVCFLSSQLLMRKQLGMTIGSIHATFTQISNKI